MLDGASLGEDGVYLGGALTARFPGLRARLGERCPERALAIPVGQVADGDRAAVLVLGLNSLRSPDDLYRGSAGCSPTRCMLTARAGVEAAGEGLAAGADNYLVKPFSSADLINRVAARLEAAARERSLPGGLPARRDQELAGLGAALAAARSVDQALQSLLAAPLCCLEASAAAIGILDESGHALRVGYAGDIRAEIADRSHLVDLNASLPLAQVVRADKPMIVTDAARLAPRYRQVVTDVATSARSGPPAGMDGADRGMPRLRQTSTSPAAS